MEGVDHGVRAVAFRLRRQPLNHDPHDQAAERGGDGNEPEAQGPDGLREAAAFVGQAGRAVARDLRQEQPGGAAQQVGEGQGGRGAGEAQDPRVNDELALASGWSAPWARYVTAH